jgi:hypothetical protein
MAGVWRREEARSGQRRKAAAAKTNAEVRDGARRCILIAYAATSKIAIREDEDGCAQ